jgi:signal transduction histidine kinase
MTSSHETQPIILGQQPENGWHMPVYEALQLEQRQLAIVAQVGMFVAAERNYVRRLRILARAAAAVGAGRAALFAHDIALHALVPMAVMDGLTGTGEPFSAGGSGITTIPQLRALAFGEGIAGRAALVEEPTIVADITADATFHPSMAQPDAEVLGMEPRALVCLPLRDMAGSANATGATSVASTGVLGVLVVAQSSYGRGFDERTVELLQAVGAQATLALAVEARERDLRLERVHMIEAQEHERRRLARDLSAGPAHGVASAVTSLETIDGMIAQHPEDARAEVRRLHTLLTHTLRDVRGVLFDLRPFTLQTDGLAMSLHDLSEHFKSITSLHMRWIVDLPERLPQQIETAIYLIVREALNNVVRHAQATACMVEVRQTGQSVRVVVRDNGEGFDADALLADYPRGQSWGLLNMYDQARPLTDRFAIRSRPEQGTSVEMEIPLPARMQT